MMVRDVVTELRSRISARQEQPNEFDKGVRFGIYESLSLIQQQARLFGLDLKLLNLDYNLDEEFLKL